MMEIVTCAATDRSCFVLEDARGRCVGIETKASTTVTPSDFAGLRKLAGLLDESFVRGIVLYRGREAVSLDDRFLALPVDALWSLGAVVTDR